MNTPSNSGRQFDQSISIKIAKVMRIIYYDEIVYLQGDDSYTYINLLNKQRCLVSKSLIKFERKLCESHFFRCHKSFMINRLFIKEIRFNSVPEVCLTTGDMIPISRRRLSDLRRFLKN